MSLHIDFEPHSWYRGFAIKRNNQNLAPNVTHKIERYDWYAVIANGMTGYLVEFEADTLRELKEKIQDWYGGTPS
jgi:hypothetical protein